MTGDGLRVVVVGAGAAGMALAARAALGGHTVVLTNRPGPRLDAVARAGPLRLTEPDGSEHEARVPVTADLRAAGRDADAVVLAVGSSAQGETLCGLAGSLRPGCVVLLVPGHCGGAWCATAALLAAAHPVPPLAELPLPFVCRQSGPADVAIRQDKSAIHLGAAFRDRAAARDVASRLGYPVTEECTLLEAALRNTTAVLQPVLLLANLAPVDHARPFAIYQEGMSPAAGRLAAALDGERLAAAAAYDIAPPSLPSWLRGTYGAAGRELHELVAKVPGYAGIAAPTQVDHRFLVEHVETGLVPLVALGGLVGVTMPCSSATVELAAAATGQPLWERGRGLDRMLPPGVATSQALEYLVEKVGV
jgi:opine dehydrogenase